MQVRGFIRSAHVLKRCLCSIRIKNTLIDGENILPLPHKKLKWYACGPTVYDDAHLGHARTYINTDVIRRIISDYFKVDIDFAMGMTDIDDKIILRAAEKDIPWQDLARTYEKRFLQNMESLNVRRPDTILRVTEHIDDILDYIQRIEGVGKAYTTPSGVYFDVAKSIQSYGKLGNIPSAVDVEGNLDGGTGLSKKDNRDFALWKIFSDAQNKQQPVWNSPWGPGRPGWHIECSAMTHAYFGDGVHVHSGGIDLRFPHHTNEIAQSEAHGCCNHWVDYWIHTGHLYIKGRKMSKSLKNFISIDDYLSGQWTGKSCISNSPQQIQTAAADLRMFFLQHKYHSSLHFSPERIHEAGVIRKKFESVLELSRTIMTDIRDEQLGGHYRPLRMNTASLQLAHTLASVKEEVQRSLADDFDTPTALMCLMDLAGQLNHFVLQNVMTSTTQSIDPVPTVSAYLQEMLCVFGFRAIYDSPGQRVQLCGGSSESSMDRSGDRIFEGDNHNGIGSSRESAGNVVNSFVKFRSAVRQNSVGGLKELKRIGSEDQSSTLKDAHQACTLALQGVLRDCDTAREELLADCGVEIKDIGQKSTWSFRDDKKT